MNIKYNRLVMIKILNNLKISMKYLQKNLIKSKDKKVNWKYSMVKILVLSQKYSNIRELNIEQRQMINMKPFILKIITKKEQF